MQETNQYFPGTAWEIWVLLKVQYDNRGEEVNPHRVTWGVGVSVSPCNRPY